MRRISVCNLISVFFSLTLVTGCGGGGSSTATPTSGYYIDGAVQGLTYVTPTQSGTTDANGAFKYIEGETVTFKLYGKTLVSPLAYTYLTPFDLGGASVNPNYSINLVRFLMALDTDGNATNGITLPAYNGTLDVDFDNSIAGFEADADGKIAAFLNANANSRTLPTVQAAVAHLDTSLGNINSSYSLSLNGNTATSVITNSYCSNSIQQGWRYSFGQSSVQLVGADGFITTPGSRVCTASAQGNLNVAYNTIASGEFLDCAPTCTYRQLNRVTYVAADADGRTAVVWSWHTPNTKQIASIKTILVDPANPGQSAALSTFYELVTLN
jgi:hypothetical protein